MADIGLNPPRTDRRQIIGVKSTGAGVKYAHVVIYDSGDASYQAVKLPTGAGNTGVAGVVADQGDPNDSGKHPSGGEFGVCRDGIAEVYLEASATATKGGPAITAATAGTVKDAAGSAPYDVVGYFMETKTAGAGAAELVSIDVSIQRRFA